jgi:hydrogenase maturation protease
MSKKSILVLGVGNFLLSDEGVGIHVAHQLQNMPLASDVEVMDGGTGGFELIQHFQGRKKVIIIDAVNTDDKPGTVFRFTPEDIALLQQETFSAHQFNLIELFFFVQQMTLRPEVVVYGIVPLETKQFSTKLSRVVSGGIKRMLPSLLKELNQDSA